MVHNFASARLLQHGVDIGQPAMRLLVGIGAVALDDQCALHAARDLQGGRAMPMRVVPEGPGRMVRRQFDLVFL